MKNYLLSAILALTALFVGACASQTPQQLAATGIYAAGYAAASDALNHDATLIPVIQDIAVKLPQINSGKLTSNDMGVLAGELQKVGSVLPALKSIFPSDASKLDTANAFLAGVIQSNAALNGGRAPTVDQVIATTALTDFSNGLVDGIGYWTGRKSVTQSSPGFYPGYVVK